MLSATHLTKQYRTGNGSMLTVLDDVSFELGEGDTFSIVGPSGSGKTTLLGLCAGLDRATSGSVELNGIALEGVTDAYKRFLEGRFRKAFDLTGTPLRVEMKTARNPYAEKDS